MKNFIRVGALALLLPVLAACSVRLVTPVTATPAGSTPAASTAVAPTVAPTAASNSAAANPLVGIEWQVTDQADPRNTTGMTNMLPGATLTANFGADNVISGSAGCNTYSGAYQLSGSTLTIPGPLATTKMMCSEEIMGQEKVFLDNLLLVQGYKIDSVAPQLHLLNSKGQVIILLKKP